MEARITSWLRHARSGNALEWGSLGTEVDFLSVALAAGGRKMEQSTEYSYRDELPNTIILLVLNAHFPSCYPD